MEQLLSDKVAVVTGGSSGIGEAVVRTFVAHGAKVIIADIQDETGEKLADELNASEKQARYIHTDVSKPEDCKNMVDATVQTFGKLDIACNNAGVGDGETAIGDKDIDQWNRVININLNGVFYGMRYQIPEILKQGGGAIVNMASILSEVGFPKASAYTTAKHGMIGLTKNAALEYAASNIRVNAVGPAFINTPILQNLDDDTRNSLVHLHPAGRLGESQEVAELVLWLSSEKATFCHGGYYPIDGGYLSQ